MLPRESNVGSCACSWRRSAHRVTVDLRYLTLLMCQIACHCVPNYASFYSYMRTGSDRTFSEATRERPESKKPTNVNSWAPCLFVVGRPLCHPLAGQSQGVK